MRNFIIGLIVGIMLCGSFAYAASRIVLVNGSGNELGTSANPLIVRTN